jgi:hypothetical protein
MIVMMMVMMQHPDSSTATSHQQRLSRPVVLLIIVASIRVPSVSVSSFRQHLLMKAVVPMGDLLQGCVWCMEPDLASRQIDRLKMM